jgi:hypothetical protein
VPHNRSGHRDPRCDVLAGSRPYRDEPLALERGADAWLARPRLPTRSRPCGRSGTLPEVPRPRTYEPSGSNRRIQRASEGLRPASSPLEHRRRGARSGGSPGRIAGL